MKKTGLRLLRLWKEGSIYEERVLEGWEATLKINKKKFYAFNLTDGEFEPTNIRDKKVLQKMKQIVLPELKTYYKKLQSNKAHDAALIDRECKLSGIPINVPD